jgi:phosphopantetheinyl transferase
LVVVPDPPDAIGSLLKRLSPGEQAEAHRRLGQGHRHFVLGRLAAHAAMRGALELGTGPASIEVTSGAGGEPRSLVDGTAHVVSVSISHIGRLAAACAWRSTAGYAAGVDLERVRPTCVAESAYAFSGSERSLLSRTPQGPALAGLAGWALKEAVWKALWPHQPPNPATVEIRALNGTFGHATVAVDRRYLSRFRPAAIRARVRMLEGPDGDYVMAVAEIGAAPLKMKTWQRWSRRPLGQWSRYGGTWVREP